MGLLGIALQQLKDDNKDKSDGRVHCIVYGPNLNTVENSILIDNKLYDSRLNTKDQTESKESFVKFESSTDKNPE